MEAKIKQPEDKKIRPPQQWKRYRMDGPRLVNLLQISCCNFSVFTALKIDSLQKILNILYLKHHFLPQSRLQPCTWCNLVYFVAFILF